MKLSSRQQSIIDFVNDHKKRHGYPPTVREIAEAVGLASTSTVHGHLERMERKGLIKRDPQKPRALQIFVLAEKTN